MRAKEKILTTLIGIILLLAILIPIKSNAALQANGSKPSTKQFTYGKYNGQSGWFESIRRMETEGETLGLTGSDSVTQDTLSNPNNLDIHMQKNTEYGAMVILSSSNYGKSVPVHVVDLENGILSTTTGNKSGVYMSINKEWVVGTHELFQDDINYDYYPNASLKYKNLYYPGKKGTYIGDALLETSGWHNTGKPVKAHWYLSPKASFVRALSGSIFSYGGDASTTALGGDNASINHKYHSRAVVVVGEGF